MVRVQLPPQLLEDAQAYADGTREPAEPRNAATVVLMRRGEKVELHPGDDHILLPGDQITIMAESSTLHKVNRLNR